MVVAFYFMFIYSKSFIYFGWIVGCILWNCFFEIFIDLWSVFIFIVSLFNRIRRVDYFKRSHTNLITISVYYFTVYCFKMEFEAKDIAKNKAISLVSINEISSSSYVNLIWLNFRNTSAGILSYYFLIIDLL